MKRSWKKTGAVAAIIMTCMSFLAGCGKAAATEERGSDPAAVEAQDGNTSDAEIQEGTAAADEQEEPASDTVEQRGETVTNDGKGELISDEDAAALSLMKKYMVEDVYGDGALYEVYGPDGSENSDGFLSYIDHGISFFASVFSSEEKELPYFMLNESLKAQKEDWESVGQYSDVQLGEVIKNGEDRYVTASAKSEDSFGTAYEVKKLYYLDVPKAGSCVLWEVEVTEVQADEETEKIITQLGQCYGIGLESIMPDGGWAQADADRQVEAQDVYEPDEGDAALTKVDGYQYLGQTTLSFRDGAIQCPVMLPMGYLTSVMDGHATASMHGIYVSISSTPTGSDEYVPLLKRGAERVYEQKLNDEDVEYRNVHKSEIMEMDGYEQAWYYVVDYERPDLLTGEYYKEVSVNCRIIIGENYFLICDITLYGNDYDSSTNTLLKELETAYGIDLSAYYYEGE